jgi:tetratricopeptide (TPR) repeat protein
MKIKLCLTAVFSILLVTAAVGQDPASKVTNSTNEFLVKAQKLMDEGKPTEALKVLEQASALQPNNERAVVGQYMLLVKLKRPKDGIKVLDKWIAAKPDDPNRLFWVAMTTGETGQYAESLKAFDKLIKLQPDNGNHWVGKGQCLAAMNRNAEALQAFDKAIAMNPQRADVRRMREEVLAKVKKSGPAQPGDKAGKTKIPAAEAKDYVGETLVVAGRIAQVAIREKQVYLNLDKKYPDSPLTCVIFAPATNLFGDLRKLEGKQVEVKGKIADYKGRPQIVLTSPNQLTVVEPAGTGRTGQSP